MSSSYYKKCASCEKGVWTADLAAPCPECGDSLYQKNAISFAIKCIHWDRIGRNKDGYHSGVQAHVTSKADLLRKAAAKGLRIEFD